ncbi:MAG: hypothetical protein AVDCRST_MAG19-2017, partial [uncultured Thermomicrobiales bacterium]
AGARGPPARQPPPALPRSHLSAQLQLPAPHARRRRPADRRLRAWRRSASRRSQGRGSRGRRPGGRRRGQAGCGRGRPSLRGRRDPDSGGIPGAVLPNPDRDGTGRWLLGRAERGGRARPGHPKLL